MLKIFRSILFVLIASITSYAMVAEKNLTQLEKQYLTAKGASEDVLFKKISLITSMSKELKKVDDGEKRLLKKIENIKTEFVKYYPGAKTKYLEEVIKTSILFNSLNIKFKYVKHNGIPIIVVTEPSKRLNESLKKEEKLGVFAIISTDEIRSINEFLNWIQRILYIKSQKGKLEYKLPLIYCFKWVQQKIIDVHTGNMIGFQITYPDETIHTDTTSYTNHKDANLFWVEFDIVKVYAASYSSCGL